MLKRRLLTFLLTFLAAGLLLRPARTETRSIERRFRDARRDEPSLIAFLKAMPKGGDLHNHAGGSLYAEDGLREAIRHNLYFDPATSRFEEAPGGQRVPAARLEQDDRLRYQFFNAVSVRGGYGSAAGGHDHFFAAFGPVGSAWRRTPVEEALAPLVRRARLQNLQYLELMQGVGGPARDRIAGAVAAGDSMERMLEKIRPLLPEYVREAKAALDRWDRIVAEKADVPAPVTGPGGPVTVRYLETAYRAGPNERIFATWASAFALMQADPRVVGVNFAAPEDHPIAVARFDEHMRMLDFLWKAFDRPNVTLHAGELNSDLSRLEDMTFHIRRSIDTGHARRIGHGTAVAWEEDCPGLLRKMREERIAVEVCPSSEAVILGATGDRHPFRLYHRAGVPLTINTDDEGVLRSNLTLEFVRAVRAWNLSYAEVKELVRNSLEYSFLPGESLFEGRGYGRLRAPLRRLPRHGWVPDEEEARALAGSPKAAVQARLERALADFER